MRREVATVPLAQVDLGGEGEPLVMLHGLLGSSRSLLSTGRKLSAWFKVHVLDLRNHGRSPHDALGSFAAMSADVLRWLDDNALERVVLLGHSLGGKVAMRLACDAPSRVERLFVLDIAPRAYVPDSTILDALLEVDLSGVTRRAEVEEQLEDSIRDRATRLFLLTNLVRQGEGFRWMVNLEALKKNFDSVSRSPLTAHDHYAGGVRFIVGGASSYFADEDAVTVRRHFPQAEIVTLEGVGHNVHTEGGDAFLEAIKPVQA